MSSHSCSFRQHAYAAIHLEESLVTSTLFFSRGLEIVSHKELHTILLPYAGLIHGFIKTVQSIDTIVVAIKNRKTTGTPQLDTLDYVEQVCNTLANGNLLYQSAVFTSTAVALVSWSFALSAAAELSIATRSLYKQIKCYQNRPGNSLQPHLDLQISENIILHFNSKAEKRVFFESLLNVAARLLAVIGWSAIALGNPIGWALVGLASLQCLYKAASVYHDFGLFGHSQSEISLQRVGEEEQVDAETEYSAINIGRG